MYCGVAAPTLRSKSYFMVHAENVINHFYL